MLNPQATDDSQLFSDQTTPRKGSCANEDTSEILDELLMPGVRGHRGDLSIADDLKEENHSGQGSLFSPGPGERNGSYDAATSVLGL
ncbi:hypothetical protein E4U37_006743 [Claviceps purpurea]|nr:hypothetical protein E4U37_006743 [Claviceps purpurea]